MERLEGIYKKYENMKVLSGSSLKMIALITMIIDHIGAFLLSQAQFANEPIVSIGSHAITLYFIVRKIGRLAFPIYCFLITEGYLHTHDKKRYGLNLLIFALISEIPWNLEHSGHLLYSGQNVFFTLFLGYLAICAYERFKDDRYKMFTCLFGLFALSILLRADYGSRGLGFILFLYIMRDRKILQAIVGSCFFSGAYAIIVAFLPINMYNGERGFIKTKAAKYAFYIAYPLHIFILYLIRLNTFGYN